MLRFAAAQNLSMTTIKILEQKSEIGAGTRGAGLGVDAIKTAAFNRQSTLFSHYPHEEVPNENELLFHPVRHPHARYIEGITKIYDRTSTAVAKTLTQQFFPLVLSGDHSSAGATIAGIKIAYPKSRLGVIWIDAHADLHTPYTSPSGNVHGMPLAISLSEDNLSHKKNELTPEVTNYWEQLKKTGHIAPKVLPQDIVIIGVRDYEKEEDALIREKEIHTFPVAGVREKGSEQIAKATLSLLNDCDLIYLSFDVDSLDPDVSKGTGTPVANGFRKEEASELIFSLLADEKICCFEIAEVNPTLDTENKMAAIAFDVLAKGIEIIKARSR